jgi:hypothetical protein
MRERRCYGYSQFIFAPPSTPLILKLFIADVADFFGDSIQCPLRHLCGNRCSNTKLGKMSADRIDHPGLLTNK